MDLFSCTHQYSKGCAFAGACALAAIGGFGAQFLSAAHVRTAAAQVAVPRRHVHARTGSLLHTDVPDTLQGLSTPAGARMMGHRGRPPPRGASRPAAA
jgi:hypothetical protein